jgi:TRAP-type C4-dicarboxylate transport system permease small subunit
VKAVAKLHDGLVYGMAFIAAFLMAAMMVVITLDVVLRNLGYQSSAHFFTFTEYALLIVPCMGAPWLAREKGISTSRSCCSRCRRGRAGA